MAKTALNGLPLLFVACSLAACGGGTPLAPTPSTPAPSPTPTPPPPPRIITETQTVTGSVNARSAVPYPLTIEHSGDLRLEVLWPGKADLDLLLTSANGCTDPFGQRCEYIDYTDWSWTVNLEMMVRKVTAGERYMLWVSSAWPDAGLVTYTLTIRLQYPAE